MLSPIVAWRGKPVFVVRRDADTLASLETDTEMLADPDSAVAEQQPDFAVNAWRSERLNTVFSLVFALIWDVRQSTSSQIILLKLVRAASFAPVTVPGSIWRDEL